MSGEVPVGWQSLRFGDVIRSFAGGTPSRSNAAYYGPGVPWLKSGEVRAGRITTVEEQITELGLRQSSARIAKAGSPVIAMYGATAGVAGILEIDAALNQAVLAIEPVATKLDNEFCFHLLSAEAPRLLGMTQGSGQPNLSKGLIDGLNVALPPLDEQRRIAEVLRSVDEAIATSEKSLAQLQQSRDAIRNDHFRALLGAGKAQTLGSLCEITKLAGFEYTKHINYGESDEIIAVRGLNIKDGRLLLDDIKTISRNASRALPRSALRNGDLVMSYVGTIGEVAKIKTDDRFHLAPNVALIRCGERTLPDYVLHFLYSQAGREQIDKNISASSQQSLSMGKIRSFEIVLPRLEDQQNLIALLDTVETALTNGRATHAQFLSLKSCLLDDLLSGRVRVPA